MKNGGAASIVDLVQELSDEELKVMLWKVYASWEKKEEPKEVDGKFTWPLPFNGPKSVTTLLEATGWSHSDISIFEEALFNNSERHRRRSGCHKGEVTWPDLQQVFREAHCAKKGVKEWVDENPGAPEAHPLNKRVRLRLAIERRKIKDLFVGKWRM